jgi:cardiolipin synthase
VPEIFFFFDEETLLLSSAAFLVHVLGIVSALHAVMKTRTSQGAIAWLISLLTFPYLTVPLYWAFGRGRFYGYVQARRQGDAKIAPTLHRLRQQHLLDAKAELPPSQASFAVLQRLIGLPFVSGNDARLVVDGEAGFHAVFEAIDQAKDYILLQFYIVRDDAVGSALKERLIARAREGIRIYFLFDRIGSYALPRSYVEELRSAGVVVQPFRIGLLGFTRLQINFRNHRKIVLTDGCKAIVGGFNVGDEYLGHDPGFGHWRDTSVCLEGPVVSAIQLAFVEDWYWATREVPELTWTAAAADSANRMAIALAFGPADDFETGKLFFINAINAARKRIWIASPYLIPDQEALTALQLAALRGVEVRLLLPEKMDHLLSWFAMWSYFKALASAGVRILLYRREAGFMHQKVLVVDDEIAAVGTANFDNRSFRLNFELMVLLVDGEFAAATRNMLEADFAHCREMDADALAHRPYWFRLAARGCRLLAPVL